MNFIYKPIIGDRIYAPNRESALGFDRLALHARKIEFKNQNNEKVFYEADYPDDFNNAINLFR